MRLVIVCLCLSLAACTGQAPASPTSPSLAPAAPAHSDAPGSTAQASGAAELPFKGSFTITTTGTVNCPPTCPPTTLRVEGREEGTATHLGRFTAVSVDTVDMATATATGTFDFTAANGDRLLTTTTGGEDQFVPPNISHVSVVATIVGGTGRFAGATGTLTIRYVGEIDFANGRSSGSGSIDGHIVLR
jgi:hypothetical protein